MVYPYCSVGKVFFVSSSKDVALSVIVELLLPTIDVNAGVLMTYCLFEEWEFRPDNEK